MSFLSGLGAFSQGASQGIDQGSQLALRAQQIGQAHLALDQAKRQLAADAAAFTGLGGGNGFALPGPQGPAPQPQPMMPGQPSVPSGGPSPQGQAVSPQGGPVTAPPPQAGGGASLPQQPQPSGPNGIDPLDPRAAVQTVMSIAQEIKSRNPNIDPQTLMLATSRIIDMSKGLAPALRQGAQVVIQQMKDATSQANTAARVGATERGQDIGASNVEKRVAATERGQDISAATSLQRVAQQGRDAMARTQASIDAANQRASQGVWSREKTAAYKERANAAGAKLKAANSRLTSLTAAGVKADDPRVTQAGRDIASATAELDRVNKAAGLDQGTVPQAAPAPAGGARPTATNAKGEQLEWNGSAWVPVGK